jgi:hypothetical protein
MQMDQGVNSPLARILADAMLRQQMPQGPVSAPGGILGSGAFQGGPMPSLQLNRPEVYEPGFRPETWGNFGLMPYQPGGLYPARR